MSGSDTDNEGQLLIDESEDRAKQAKGKRKKAPARKTRKKPVKLIVKTKIIKKNPNKQKEKSEKPQEKSSTVVNARKSTRVRKQTRKHSPPPIVVKFPRTKATVKKETTPAAAEKSENDNSEEKEEIANNSENNLFEKASVSIPVPDLDIESVSDEDELGMMYSASIVMDPSPSLGAKKKRQKKKAGIKLKLSLGKVLSPKIASDVVPITEEVGRLENGLDANERLKEMEDVELFDAKKDANQVVEPLRIPKRFCSTDCDIDDGDAISKKDELTTGDGDTFYSSSSEEHKPLTLRLSMGKPQAVSRSNSMFKSSQASPQAFPNIRRSWSVNPTGSQELKLDSSPPKVNLSPPGNTKLPSNPVVTDDKNSPLKLFSPGLQSLLDVVSVELNEQNFESESKSETNQNVQQIVTPSKKSPTVNKTSPNPAHTHRQNKSDPPSTKNDHLPSLAFPKPQIHFPARKRPRVKSVTSTTPVVPKEKSGFSSDETVDDSSQSDEVPMSEKRVRRQSKRKELNPDFVDPDTVITGPDEVEKKKPRRNSDSVPLFAPKVKPLGSSLLMPQMCSTLNNSKSSQQQIPKITAKVSVVRKPKKGMATAKQRLANKLRLGRTY